MFTKVGLGIRNHDTAEQQLRLEEKKPNNKLSIILRVVKIKIMLTRRPTRHGRMLTF